MASECTVVDYLAYLFIWFYDDTKNNIIFLIVNAATAATTTTTTTTDAFGHLFHLKK